MVRKNGNRVSRRPQPQNHTPAPPALPFGALTVGGNGINGALKRYGIEECPQCKAAFNDTNCRPVQDSCGHFKCRVCFIGNEDGCSQCKDAQPSRTRKGGPSTSRAIENENCNGNAGSSNIGKSSNSQLKSKIDVSNHAPLVSGPNKNSRPPLELNSVSELGSSCLDPIYQGNSNLEGECRGLPDYSIHDNSLLHSTSYSSIINQESEFSKSLMSLRKAADLQTNDFTTNGHGLPNCTRNNYVPTDNSNLDCTFPSLVPLGSTERGLVTRAQVKEFPNTQLTELKFTVKRKKSDDSPSIHSPKVFRFSPTISTSPVSSSDEAAINKNGSPGHSRKSAYSTNASTPNDTNQQQSQPKFFRHGSTERESLKNAAIANSQLGRVYGSSKRGNKGKSESKPDTSTNSVATKPTSDRISRSSTKLDSISDLSAQPAGATATTGQKSNSKPKGFPVPLSPPSTTILKPKITYGRSTLSKSKANGPVTKPPNEPSEVYSGQKKQVSFTLPLQTTKLTASPPSKTEVVDSKISPTTYSISLGSEPRPIIIEPVAVDIDSSNIAPLTTEHTFELVTVSYLDICPTDTPALSIPSVPAPKSPTKNVSPTEPKDKKKKKRNPVVIHDHITVISGDPTMFQCNVCQKKFKTKAHIKYHEFCQNGNKPFKCEECGQGFIAKSHYEYHLRTHTGERPYVCPKCGKGFNQRGKVTRHMRSHTGEKPFICTECGRGFANAQALRSHHLIHTGERPFACKYCQKRFTGMTNLKKHIITHTGERPYVCTHCGKSFGLKWTLDLHLRTHSSERPYACDQCTRAFSNSKDLRRHLVIHSGERPFKCWICGTSFRRKDNLDRHIKNTHNQPKEVAKQLANEAAAEYLASTKSAPVPLNKVNSAVISNVIRTAQFPQPMKKEMPASSKSNCDNVEEKKIMQNSNCGSSREEPTNTSTVIITAELSPRGGVYEPNESEIYEESYILPDGGDSPYQYRIEESVKEEQSEQGVGEAASLDEVRDMNEPSATTMELSPCSETEEGEIVDEADEEVSSIGLEDPFKEESINEECIKKGSVTADSLNEESVMEDQNKADQSDSAVCDWLSNVSSEDSNKRDAVQEDSVKEDAVKEDSVKEKSLNEESVKEDEVKANRSDSAVSDWLLTISSEDPLKEHSVMENSVVENSVMENSVIEDSVKEESAKEDPIKEDIVLEDPIKEDTVLEDPIKEDTVLEDPIKEDIVLEDPVKEDSLNEGSVKADSLHEDSIKEESLNEDFVKEDSAKEDPIKEEFAKEDPIKEYIVLEDPIKEDIVLEDPIKEDVVLEDPIKADLFNEESVKEDEVKANRSDSAVSDWLLTISSEDPLKEHSVMENSVVENSVIEDSVKEESAKEDPIKEDIVLEDPIKADSLNEGSVKADSLHEDSVKEDQVKADQSDSAVCDWLSTISSEEYDYDALIETQEASQQTDLEFTGEEDANCKVLIGRPVSIFLGNDGEHSNHSSTKEKSTEALDIFNTISQATDQDIERVALSPSENVSPVNSPTINSSAVVDPIQIPQDTLSSDVEKMELEEEDGTTTECLSPPPCQLTMSSVPVVDQEDVQNQDFEEKSSEAFDIVKTKSEATAVFSSSEEVSPVNSPTTHSSAVVDTIQIPQDTLSSDVEKMELEEEDGTTTECLSPPPCQLTMSSVPIVDQEDVQNQDFYEKSSEALDIVKTKSEATGQEIERAVLSPSKDVLPVNSTTINSPEEADETTTECSSPRAYQLNMSPVPVVVQKDIQNTSYCNNIQNQDFEKKSSEAFDIVKTKSEATGQEIERALLSPSEEIPNVDSLTINPLAVTDTPHIPKDAELSDQDTNPSLTPDVEKMEEPEEADDITTEFLSPPACQLNMSSVTTVVQKDIQNTSYCNSIQNQDFEEKSSEAFDVVKTKSEATGQEIERAVLFPSEEIPKVDSLTINPLAVTDTPHIPQDEEISNQATNAYLISDVGKMEPDEADETTTGCSSPPACESNMSPVQVPVVVQEDIQNSTYCNNIQNHQFQPYYNTSENEIRFYYDEQAYEPSQIQFVYPNDMPQMMNSEHQEMGIVHAAATAIAERNDDESGPPMKVRLLYAEALGVRGSDQSNQQLFYASTTPNQEIKSGCSSRVQLAPAAVINAPINGNIPVVNRLEYSYAQNFQEIPESPALYPVQARHHSNGMMTHIQTITDHPDSSRLLKRARDAQYLLPPEAHHHYNYQLPSTYESQIFDNRSHQNPRGSDYYSNTPNDFSASFDNERQFNEAPIEYDPLRALAAEATRRLGYDNREHGDAAMRCAAAIAAVGEAARKKRQTEQLERERKREEAEVLLAQLAQQGQAVSRRRAEDRRVNRGPRKNYLSHPSYHQD